jgi:hypothetical protein
MSDPRVAAFLAELRLIQHLEAFSRSGVTYEALPSLTEADLLDLGLVSPSERRRVLGAIREASRFPAGASSLSPGPSPRSVSHGAGAGQAHDLTGSGGFVPGQLVRDGRYRVESVLGSGGMGTVYAATDLSTGERVALKVLLPELSNHPTARERMLGEAHALHRVRSPNVVQLNAAFVEAGLLVLGLEFMPGGALDARLDGRGVDPETARAWTSHILRGLEALHAAGLVHRDLKPANVLLDAQGTLKVTDLGIAADSQRTSHLKTQIDASLGTPEYMAPEQIRSASTVDARADLYAVGVILYELLTGSVPFRGSEFDVKSGHVQRQPDLAPVRARAPELVWVVARALEKAPSERFATASEFRTALYGQTLPRPPAEVEARPSPARPTGLQDLQAAWHRDYHLPAWLARREGVQAFRRTSPGAWLARQPHWLVKLIFVVIIFGAIGVTCGLSRGRYGSRWGSWPAPARPALARQTAALEPPGPMAHLSRARSDESCSVSFSKGACDANISL